MYELLYLEAVSSDISIIPKNTRESIKSAIEERLANDPYNFGKPLRYSWKGHRRLRVGDYRVIYRVIYKVEEDKKQVLIIAIKHRKEVYS